MPVARIAVDCARNAERSRTATAFAERKRTEREFDAAAGSTDTVDQTCTAVTHVTRGRNTSSEH